MISLAWGLYEDYTDFLGDVIPIYGDDEGILQISYADSTPIIESKWKGHGKLIAQ